MRKVKSIVASIVRSPKDGAGNLPLARTLFLISHINNINLQIAPIHHGFIFISTQSLAFSSCGRDLFLILTKGLA
jgi:hypothetical protein